MPQPVPPDDGPTVTASSLILRIQAKEEAAWDRFARLYGPLIYGWCRGAGLQPSDAEDTSQDAIRAVIASVGTYQRTGSFRSWLWQVTRNKVLDHFRRRQRAGPAVGGTDFLELVNAVPDMPSHDASNLHHSVDPVLMRALDLIRDEFEPSTWTAFWRMVVEGHGASEIATDLGWTTDEPSSALKGARRVRQAKFRVVQRLKDEFGEMLDLP